MKFTTLLNSKLRFSQWTDIMRQLRPSVTPETISSLIPWRYRFVTSIQDNTVIGVGAYFPTASLVRGKYNYFADLVVDPKYRGKGIGSSMLQEVLSSSMPCELDSGLQRIEAHRLYYKLGFISTSYAVRPQTAALVSMDNVPLQNTYIINGIDHLLQQSENDIKRLQKFIDEHVSLKVSYRANLQLFMKNNPDHRLLTLQNKAGGLEGIMLFELQNRLSIGGNCFHVSDLIIKSGSEATEIQNTLLLSLSHQAKEHNLHDSTSPIQSVIVEMTEPQARSHKLLKNNEGSKPVGYSDDTSVDPLIKKLTLSPFFSVTAKHFVKAVSDKEKLPLGNWYQQRTNGF